jgi:ribosomal protein S27AE
MTETINCGNCDFLLYWGESIKDRLFMTWSEETVLQLYKNKCPNCGNSLTLKAIKVEVTD